MEWVPDGSGLRSEPKAIPTKCSFFARDSEKHAGGSDERRSGGRWHGYEWCAPLLSLKVSLSSRLSEQSERMERSPSVGHEFLKALFTIVSCTRLIFPRVVEISLCWA